MNSAPPSIKGTSGFGMFAMVQLACLLMVSLLGLWWGMLLTRQNGHLQKLNQKVKDPINLGALGDSFESMVFWEGQLFCDGGGSDFGNVRPSLLARTQAYQNTRKFFRIDDP